MTSGAAPRRFAIQDVRAATQPLGVREALAIQRRNGLAREHQRRRTIARLDRHLPGDARLVGVARANHEQIRNRAQRRQLLDRLVRRPVLAQADAVVREDEDRRAAATSAASRIAGRM